MTWFFDTLKNNPGRMDGRDGGIPLRETGDMGGYPVYPCHITSVGILPGEAAGFPGTPEHAFRYHLGYALRIPDGSGRRVFLHTDRKPAGAVWGFLPVNTNCCRFHTIG